MTQDSIIQSPLAGLEPARVWHWFGEIMRIPRPSKHEERISAFLAEWGRSHGLETQTDSLGNVLIRKPASKGYEQSPGVCLQAHMDMVCEKNSDKQFDFMTDAIQPVLDGEWLTADGTTLGADDGIGVATILAILEDDTLQHPALEALITVDEETGLTGAMGLDPSWLRSEVLLNFDDEDEGEYCIGCAGGIDTVGSLPYSKELLPADADGLRGFRLRLFGLKGGHSGDDINRGRGCAIKLINRILWEGTFCHDMMIARFKGGNLRNAIAREAEALVVVPHGREQAFRDMVARIGEAARFEFRSTEPDLSVELTEVAVPELEWVLDRHSQERLVNLLYACAHGVLSMSREIPDFVETSTNLASVVMGDSAFTIATSQRSSVESAKRAAAQKIEATFRLAGAEVTHSDGYPGWTPNPDSRVLKVGVDVYRRMYGKEPVVRAIHAGLECGLIGEKYPKMDMISYGPTLRGVHSPDERIEIKTVGMFWNQTLEILRQLK